MDIHVCSTAPDFEILRDQWVELANAAVDRSLFLTWGWLDACRSVLAPHDELKVVCVFEGSRLVGGAPFVRRRTRYYGLPVTEVAFLGDPVSDRQGFLDRTEAGEATNEIWRYLQSNPFDATMLRLEQLPAGSATVSQGRRVLASLAVEPSSELPFVRIEGSWPEFERGLAKKFRSEMRTRAKVLDTYGGWELVHLAGADVTGRLTECAALECASEKSDRGQAFFAHTDNTRLLEAFLRQASTSCVLPVLSQLRVEGSLVAYLLGFEYDGVYHAYNTAYRQEYRKASPGKLLVHAAIRRAFERNLLGFDFLRGAFFMKHEWNPVLRANCRSVFFHSRALGPLMRLAVFRFRPWAKSRLAGVARARRGPAA